MYQTKNMGLNITEMPKDTLNAFSFHTDLGYNFEAIDNLALSHRNITNCLLEVPQDIKLELVDGVLTLKEGSKLYVPNRFEADGTTLKFDEIVVNGTQVNGEGGGTNKWIVLYNTNSNGLERTLLSNCVSGPTRPTLSNYGFWYDTTNNFIERYIDNAWDSNNKRSLPLCIITITNNIITSIDQVFNGFGYIGSTVFALPGVKGLIPDGRNEDGTLNNIRIELENVSLSAPLNGVTRFISIHSDGGLGRQLSDFYLNEKDNYNYDGSRLSCVSVVDVSFDGNNIKSFIPKKPFHAVDYNDYQTKITELETKIEALQEVVKTLQGS